MDASVIISVALVVGGWLAVHLLSGRRDNTNKRRDLRIHYLLEAYRQLEACGNRPLDEKSQRALEGAIADIQLLGSEKQIGLAQEFAVDFSKARGASLDALLDALRTALRQELRLSATSKSLKHLRIQENGKKLL